MIDYEALARRALDIPPTRDERAALRVWADQLEAAGDPRGTLIALEHAISARSNRARSDRALRRAALDHALAAGLLDPLSDLARHPRALSLTWRAGQLHTLALDTRHLGQRRDVHHRIAQLLAAPLTRDLRRLELRVAPDAYDIRAPLLDAPDRRPLEELVVRTRASPPATLREYSLFEDLPAVYPALRLFIVDIVIPLPSTTLSHVDRAALLRAVASADPATPAGRASLGYALVRIDPELQTAALARLSHFAALAGAFVETLVTLLHIPEIPNKPALAACLPRLGDAALTAIPRLAATTGRTSRRYPPDLRSAAGLALAGLRALSSSH